MQKKPKLKEEYNIFKSAEKKDISAENDESKRDEICFFFSKVLDLTDLYKRHENVTSLIVIGQPVKSVSGVELLTSLTELWIVECQIEDVSAIVKCCKIEKLYLYSNNIKDIPDFSEMSKLNTLWLSGNKIREINNMQNLGELTELYLCNNYIRKIGSSLNNMKKLTVLNMSGNPIYYLKDLKNLCMNTCLESLHFADPVFGACPVVQLCNYRSYLVYSCPHLKTLDTYPVREQERDYCKMFFSNKIMCYNMLQQILTAEYYTMEKNKKYENKEKTEHFRTCLFNYTIRELQPKDEQETELLKDEHISEKLQHLNLMVKTWSDCLSHWRHLEKERLQISKLVLALQSFPPLREIELLSDFIQNYCSYKKANKYRLNFELQNVGNVMFHVGKEHDELVETCQELFDHLACPKSFSGCGISSVEVIEVLKVTNKSLDMFHSDNNCYPEKAQSTSSLTTFMLLCGKYGCHKSLPELIEVFSTDFTYDQTKSLEVSDCLACVDHEWIRTAIRWKEKIYDVPKEVQNSERLCVIVQVPDNISLQRLENKCGNEQQTDTTNSNTNKLKVCNMYHVRNVTSVIPMFIVTYKYIYKNFFDKVKENMGWTCDIHASTNISSPFTQQYQHLDIETMPSLLPTYTSEIFTEIVLKGCGINSIGNLPTFPNISNLDFSFNYLKNFNGFEVFVTAINMNLSHNSFHTLDGMMEFKKLKILNLSWNHLKQLENSLVVLKKATKLLETLDIFANPLNDVKGNDHMLYMTYKYIPELKTLDHIDMHKGFVSKFKTLQINEKSESEYSAGTMVPTYIQQHVNLKWKAVLLKEVMSIAQNKTEYNDRAHRVTWISANNMNIVQLKDMEEELKDVQYVDLSDNLLHQCSVLKDCVGIKELDLSNNMIYSLDNSLMNMKNLVKLNLSGNSIKSIATMSTCEFPFLKLLDVSNNLLDNLNGIEACTYIEELYASHNNIQQFKDIFNMRSCRQLHIINMMGNSFTQNPLYNMFIIYHFREIEYVDKHRVKETDIQEAIQLFGGCLDKEYLMKQHKVIELQNMTTLTLTHCELKQINLPGEVVPNLESIDLSHNLITSTMGLHELPSLKVLCLANNNLGQCLESSLGRCNKDYFPKLEIIYVNNNCITSLRNLGLTQMPKLTTLYSHCNEIRFITGNQFPETLLNLILDHNSIENVSVDLHLTLSQLKELYLEGNKIKTLQFLRPLQKLQRLFLAFNSIKEKEETKHLVALKCLVEVTLHGNPICHKYNHYQLVLQTVPSLKMIDGYPLKT